MSESLLSTCIGICSTFLGSGRVVVQSWPGNGSPVPERRFFYEGVAKLIKPALFSEFRFLNDVTPTAGRWPRPSASMLYYNNNKGSFQQLSFFKQIVVTPGRQSLLSPVAPALCKQQLKRNPPPPEEKFSKRLERKNRETPLVKKGLLPRGGRSWPSC